MNKLVLTLACIILSLCIGSVYSWSIFILPIQEVTNFSLPAIQLVFCLTIFTLGITTSLAGKFISSHKPYIMALLGTILFTIGMIFTGLMITFFPPGIYITYGILLGIGTGIIYLIPIPLLLQAFPNNPALGTSISILAFGFGSAVFIPIAKIFPIFTDAFIIIGIVYGLLMTVASLMLEGKEYIVTKMEVIDTITPEKAIKTKEFYYIFTIIFINILIGISLISIAAPFGKELLLDAALLVSIIGLSNGLGRPIWAAFADKIGHINIYKILFIVQILCILIMVLSKNSILIMLTLCIIISCYGAGFSCCPALISAVFGKTFASEIFGKVLFAWGIAGLIGPFLISILYTYLETYLISIILLSSLYFIGLYCSTKIKKLI